MLVQRMNRKSEGFYEVMGPVFGSRMIEQETRDRFYDDAGKEWYVLPGQGAASVKEDTIRNFWAASEAVADALLAQITADYTRVKGIVPRKYEQAFKRAEFKTSAHRVNFLEVQHVQDKKH